MTLEWMINGGFAEQSVLEGGLLRGARMYLGTYSYLPTFEVGIVGRYLAQIKAVKTLIRDFLLSPLAAISNSP